MRAALLPPVAVALALLAPAAAQECEMTTSAPEVDVDLRAAGEGRYYVDVDGPPCNVTVDPFGLVSYHPWRAVTSDCAFATWTYQESNGIDGLQRGDELRDDTCGRGWPYSDTLAFY